MDRTNEPAPLPPEGEQDADHKRACCVSGSVAGGEAPFNSIEGLAGWASAKGFKGAQIPTWDKRVIDLKCAAESQTYCDDYAGKLAEHGLVITELASHLQGQLVALHPAYDHPADSFAAPEVRGNPVARQAWAVEQLHLAAKVRQSLSRLCRSYPGPS